MKIMGSSIESTVARLESLMELGRKYYMEVQGEEMSRRPAPGKWSKKEIMGHLIDSGINNLQRFTEIQFRSKPYIVRKYDQNALVEANAYQDARMEELGNLWHALNARIACVMRLQTPDTLAFEIEIGPGEMADLQFLMVDYVDHLQHHLIQVTGQPAA